MKKKIRDERSRAEQTRNNYIKKRIILERSNVVLDGLLIHRAIDDEREEGRS